MRLSLMISAFSATLATLGTATAQTPPPPMAATMPMAPQPEAAKPLVAPILGTGGKAIGKAEITPAPTGALIQLSFEKGALPPGWHGVHLHEKPDCSDAGFKAAGGHIGHGQGGELHGLLGPKPETGDLPNLFAPKAQAFSAQLFVSAAPLSTLMAAGGFALVVHANIDDQVSQPIGNAGARIACAAFKA
jgi:superoxide dismutase, Cu-Zn family